MTSAVDTREPYESYRPRLGRGGESVADRTAAYLAMADRRKELNAFLELFREDAAASALAADAALADGTAGPLAGMAVAVKDLIAMKGKRASCGSHILERFESVYDATVIAKLRKAGALFIGRTNMDEFAMGSSNENSAFGPVRHPLDPERVPGGSSGGSAVVVAAGMATVALGSDTGGSVRQPAGLCGIAGLKPTYGRLSRYGLTAFASSFDQIGIFANSCTDIATVLSVTAGHDPLDTTSADMPVPDYRAAMTGSVKGLRIGLPKEYFSDALGAGVRTVVERSIARLKEAGAVFSEVSLPNTEYTIPVYYILATAEASSNLARFDGARYGYRSPEANALNDMYVRSRSEGFGAEVKRRIMLGTYVLSSGYYDAYYGKAQRVRRLIRDDFLRVFGQVDCLLTPIAPGTAFRLGEKTEDPMQMYLSDIYTVSANLAGIPGLSVPGGTDAAGLPVGVQLLGRHFDEATLLRAGGVLERFS